jgi:hypothetical protein
MRKEIGLLGKMIECPKCGKPMEGIFEVHKMWKPFYWDGEKYTSLGATDEGHDDNFDMECPFGCILEGKFVDELEEKGLFVDE